MLPGWAKIEFRKFLMDGRPGGRSLSGRPRSRWIDGVLDDLGRMGFRSYKSKAQDREEWRGVVTEARALQVVSM